MAIVLYLKTKYVGYRPMCWHRDQTQVCQVDPSICLTLIKRTGYRIWVQATNLWEMCGSFRTRTSGVSTVITHYDVLYTCACVQPSRMQSAWLTKVLSHTLNAVTIKLNLSAYHLPPEFQQSWPIRTTIWICSTRLDTSIHKYDSIL